MNKKRLGMLAAALVFGLVLVTAGCPTGPEETNGPAERAFGLVTIDVTEIPARYQNQSASLSLRHITSGEWASGGRSQQVEGSSVSFALAAFPGTYGIELLFGSSHYVVPSRNITAGNHSILFSAFIPLEQVSITVTGIPDHYIGSSGNRISGIMNIMLPGTFARSGTGSSQSISGASATFSTRVIPGSYDVHLRFRDDDNRNTISHYSALLKNIAAGTNTIPFSYFVVVQEITITVTGIPNRYIGAWSEIRLNSPSIIDRMASSEADAEGSSVTASPFALPGIYDIVLVFSYETEDNWYYLWYSLPSRNITAGINTISFSAFTAVPSMSITVTGIPNEYIGGEKDIYLTFPNTNVWVADGWTYPLTGTSATIDFFWRFDEWAFNEPGTYRVYLEFWSEYGEGKYFIPSRRLNAGSNTIPFSAFAPVTPAVSGSIRGFTENTMPGRFGERTRSLTDR